MALGPERLLADDQVPARLRQVFSDVEVVWLDDVDEPSAAYDGGDFRRLPRGDQMSRILVQNTRLAGAVRQARSSGRLPVVSAGNCSSSLGMVGGLDDEGLGMIWFDAHSDAMTPDNSPNGLFDGMPVSTIAGKCWPVYRGQIPGFHVIPEDRIITVGNHEYYAPGGRRDWGDHAMGYPVDPPTIKRRGFEGAMGDALDRVAERTDRVFIQFDADVMDPTVLRGNSHCAQGGLLHDQAELALSMIGARFRILAVCFSAFDPEEDPRGVSVMSNLVVAAAKFAAHSLL